MKRSVSILLISFSFFCSCKKSNIGSDLVSINMIQANFNLSGVYIYFTNSDSAFYAHQAVIPFGAAAEYSTAPNSPLVIVSTSDTSVHLLSTMLNLTPGGIYSLYLAGDVSHIDTLLMQDVLPSYSDSSGGVRFINLSTGSLPVKVNLQGNDPSQTEFNSIGYKQITPFKSYTGSGGTNFYTFEIRDQTSDSLLSTFTWSVPLFKNSTLIVSGSEDPAVGIPINIFQVNNY